MNKHIETFVLAWAQVALISLNTWQIANSKYIGALIVGFFISLVWTMNVKKIAFSEWTVRIVYCTGASVGTATGLILSNLIYQH